MKHQLGTFLQFIVLVFLPMLILWQLSVGFPLVWMPLLLLVGVAVFTLGTRLRES